MSECAEIEREIVARVGNVGDGLCMSERRRRHIELIATADKLRVLRRQTGQRGAWRQRQRQIECIAIVALKLIERC